MAQDTRQRPSRLNYRSPVAWVRSWLILDGKLAGLCWSGLASRRLAQRWGVGSAAMCRAVRCRCGLLAWVSPPRMGEVAAVVYDGMQRARPPRQGSLIMPDPPCLLAQSIAGTGRRAKYRRR